MTLKGHGKFEKKLTLGFQFSPGKILSTSFFCFFCLKGTLVQLKTVVGV